MTATAEKLFGEVSGGQNSRSIGWIVRNVDEVDFTDNDALDLLETETPLTYDGMSRESIEIEEVNWHKGIWKARVNYSRTRKQPLTTSSSAEYSFDIGLTSKHIVQSLATVSTYVPSGGTSEDFGKAISVDVDGVPQGVDVQVPVSTFSVRIVLSNATVSSSYQKGVRELVGTVNNATFYDHDAGEVLFVGCSGTKRSGQDWELTYKFNTAKNRTGITIGDITGIAVKGWELLWVRYSPDVSDANRYIQKPVQVNIERIYESSDFSLLGIGT